MHEAGGVVEGLGVRGISTCPLLSIYPFPPFAVVFVLSAPAVEVTAVAAAVGAVAGTVVGRTAVELEDGTIGDACKEVVPVGSVLGISIGLGVKLLWWPLLLILLTMPLRWIRTFLGGGAVQLSSNSKG